MYFLSTDHAGINVRDFIVKYFRDKGIKLIDISPQTNTSVDYPDFAQKLCREVLSNPNSKGILVCGSGIGMSISANRFEGIRAALCTDAYMAKMSRMHNDANVLCIGERVSGLGEIESIIDAFLEYDFVGDRHLVRIQKIENFK